MRLATDIKEKRRIYSEGNQNQTLTLQSLSFDSESRYETLTIYNLYRYAFEQVGMEDENDVLGNFDGRPEEIYADTIVDDLFRLKLDRIEATGALVMNVYMAYLGALFSLLETCHLQPGDQAKMHKLLDEAAAYWVGHGQVKGDANTGHSLYNLAEFAGVKYGQDQGQVRVNTVLLETMAFIKVDISARKCELNGNAGYIDMRKKVQVLLGLVNTVLVQMLMHHVQEVETTGSSDFCELYALSIYPQIAACNPSMADALFDLTVVANVTAATRPKVIDTVRESFSCLHVKCSDVGAYQSDKIPACVDDAEPKPSLAGYTPSSDVRSKARIDRDISHIAIDLHYEAYRSALLTYNLGWHSNFALVSLAKNQFTPLPNPIYDAFSQQFATGSISDPAKVIDSILLKQHPIAGATSTQEASLVEGLLRYVVLYVSAMDELDSAIDMCTSSGNTNSMHMLWDGGAAFLIGSMEGTEVGGYEGGKLLYGLSNELCDDFGTCEPELSISNTLLIQGLKVGSEQLIAGNCQNARQAFLGTIRPALMFPLLQGLLAYATDAEGDSEFVDLGFLESFATALVPSIQDVDPQAAQSIAAAADIEDGVTSGPVPEGVGKLFDEVKRVLPQLEVECTDIGKLKIGNIPRGVCPDDPSFIREVGQDTAAPEPTKAPAVQATNAPIQTTSAPVEVTGTAPTHAPVVVATPHADGLAWGRYTFVNTSVAENDALFTLDVKDMFFAKDADTARDIYENGRNAPNGLSGNLGVSSLKEFSTKAAAFMKEDPMYNFYRYGLYDDDSFDSANGAGGWPFGDTVISLALSPKNGNSIHLAAESAVAVNIWMMIAHRLHFSVRQCSTDRKEPATSIDSAVGLWIGKETANGKFRSGYSLYSLAQSAFRIYGNDEAEAPINTKLMAMFNTAQAHAKACESEGTQEVTQSLYHTVEDILNELGKPILQMLLYFASKDEADPTELYALSFLPRAISCDINAYTTLRDSFFDGYERGTLSNQVILKDLAGVMHCFRYSCDDIGDPAKLEANHAQVVNSICESLRTDFAGSKLAGYVPSSNVAELARLDLDLHQMDLMMRVGAYEAAEEIYSLGLNSRDSDGGRNTLKELAENSSAGPLFAIFETYFKSGSYSEEQVAMAIDSKGENRFSGSSRLQRAEFAFRSIQALTTYKAVSSSLAKAVLECKLGNNGLPFIDEAAALFVGSIEGTQAGGSKDGSGVMLMSLAKEQCNNFKKCEEQGDAGSNEFILFAMSDIKDHLHDLDCSKAEDVISERIEPMLPVPMIQASLYYASVNEGLSANSPKITVASADILTKAVLPKIQPLNQTSGATLLANSEYNPNQKPVSDGVEAMFDAYRSVIEDLKIDCDVIGILGSKNLTLCEKAPHPPATPTNLGDDLYITSTYVQDRAGIAVDVKEIEELLAGDQKVLAHLIYEEGEHSPIYDSNGLKVGRRSLAGFSINADATMGFNPLFQLAKYALSDGSGNYRGSTAGRYADTIVQQAFESGRKTTLAAEAAVALNVWMELANELFQTVQKCENGGFADEDGIHSIDEAAAYWIGDGQIAGDEEAGHLLYRLAEEMGTHFNVTEAPGQSRTNTNTLRLFHEAKLMLSLPGSCSADGTTKKRLRHIVNKIASQMMIVNIQGLLHYLRTGDRDRVNIYAHGYVPFVVSCSPTTFAFLREKLLNGQYAEVEVESIARAIENTYRCFDISCNDIGVHSSQSESTCKDSSSLQPLAGYRPEVDVRQVSQIDHDIAEIDILMRMGALEAAEDLYTNGKHARAGLDSGKAALSLHHLATSSTRSSVPEFEAFKRYFGGDNYADDIIRQAFVRDNGMGDYQRRWLVIGTSQYLVMYMAVLDSMHSAVSACASGATETGGLGHKHWDTAAAYMIGDREGPNDGGSVEGKLIWGQAKRECIKFGTCSQLIPGSAQVNDRITSLLYTGRGAITGANCDILRKTVNELSDSLLVPLFQGALGAVAELSESKGSKKEQVHAEAHVFSQAVVPIIANHDPVSASTISVNVDFAGKPLSDGLPAVAWAFVNGIRAAGIDCARIGATTLVSACTGARQGASGGEKSKLGVILGVLFGSLLAVVVVLYVRRKKRRSLESKPVFVESGGVMNHGDSDVRDDSTLPTGLDRMTHMPTLPEEYPDASAASDEDHSESVV